MQHLLLFTLISISFVSCNNHSEHTNSLIRLEALIEERPDSVLYSLERTQMNQLTNQEEKAKYALLYSMALDKNYIDTTDFRVLQPAIDYYNNNGNATDKLRTFYYQGRIYQNKGNDALAMACFIKALEEGEHSTDTLTKARIYVAQGVIHETLLKWNDAIQANLQAANYFHKKNRTDSYVNCLLKVCSIYMQQQDYKNANYFLNQCNSSLSRLSNQILGLYYSNLLTIQAETEKNHDTIRATISQVIQLIANENIDHLSLANAYLTIGEYDVALNTLSKQNHITNLSQEMRYLIILSEIYKKQNKYQAALETYTKYYELHDAQVYSIFQQDAQFVDERHALELQTIQEKRMKNRIIACSLIIFLILTALVLYIKVRLNRRIAKQAQAEKEAEHYRLLYQQMEDEKDRLTELLSYSNKLNNEIKGIISERLELLNKFFTLYITNNSDISRTVDKELDELLTNKDSFMASTRLAFAGSHPNFVKYLEEHGLTEKEIEYCCLYALGLKGKEVGTYLKMRSHYNLSSIIRAKLGLEESHTNLSIYIRKLMVSIK